MLLIGLQLWFQFAIHCFLILLNYNTLSVPNHQIFVVTKFFSWILLNVELNCAFVITSRSFFLAPVNTVCVFLCVCALNCLEQRSGGEMCEDFYKARATCCIVLPWRRFFLTLHVQMNSSILFILFITLSKFLQRLVFFFFHYFKRWWKYSQKQRIGKNKASWNTNKLQVVVLCCFLKVPYSVFIHTLTDLSCLALIFHPEIWWYTASKGD